MSEFDQISSTDGGTEQDRCLEPRTLQPDREKTDCDISIIICTYNRAEKLPLCLKNFASANLPQGVSCELICVDNNSMDQTRQVIEDFANTIGTRLHYVFEGMQGLSNARNSGLRKASGKIIAFTDDDCIVDPDWLVAIWNEFQSNPSLDLVGGRVELFDKRDLPISIRTLNERKRFTIDVLFNLIPGCNFAFRRSVLDRAILFDPLFGPGAPVGVADDADFIYRVFAAGFHIEYTPTMLVYHAHGRRRTIDRDNLDRGYLRGRGAFYVKFLLKRDANVARLAYWELRNLLSGGLRRCLSGKAPHAEAKVMRHLARGAANYLSARFVTTAAAKS